MNSKLLPLGLLAAAEDETIEGITRFQKLVFLAQREELNEQPYEFEAEKYGPFSQRLYDDLDRLVQEGFMDRSREQTQLRNTKQVYELTDKGWRAVSNAPLDRQPDVGSEELERFNQEYNQMNLWSLLEYVYEEYSNMAKNSELNI
mgnify:CR=1 FL=1